MNCLTLTDPVATAPGTDTRSLSLPVLTRAILNPMTTPPLPEQIEAHRDRMWRRDEGLRVESAIDAERFIEDVDFAKKRSESGSGLFSVYLIQSRREKSVAPQ